jgi:phospholipid-translocating ATPase
MKGADTVMAKLVVANDWMDEECANMAREGLRTLVVGRRRLTEDLWTEFEEAFHAADTQLADRDALKAGVVAKYLEYGLEILGITGVEDKLQDDVKPSLELLRNAGIRIWMLTGDKVETARCVAVSSKLVARGQYIHTVTNGTYYSFYC